MKKSFLFFGLLGLGLLAGSYTASAQTPAAGARTSTPARSDVAVTRTAKSVPNKQAQLAPASGAAQPAAASKPAPAATTAPANTNASAGARTSNPAPAAQPAAQQKQPAAQPAGSGASSSGRAQPVPASATKASR